MKNGISSVDGGLARQSKGQTVANAGVGEGQNPGRPDQEGDTRMMLPDHYYFLMSLLGYEAMGFALIFTVRFSQYLFDNMSPAPVTWDPLM